MNNYRLKPSKPMAIFGAIFGAALLIFGITQLHHWGAFGIFWCIALAAIIVFNLWSAFSRNGSSYTVNSVPTNKHR